MREKQEQLSIVDQHVQIRDDTVEITIPDDIDTALELYYRSPIVRFVVEEDIKELNEHYGHGRRVYQWQLIGFLYSRTGQYFTVSKENIGIYDSTE